MTGAETQGQVVRRASLLHQSGKIAEAAAMYKALLARHPNDAALLGLFAVTQFQLERREEAESAWRRSLAIELPARVRLNILATMMKAVKGKEQASDLIANAVIPDWPQGSVPDAGDRRMIIALARGLMALERREAAARLLEGVLPDLMSDRDFVSSAVAILLSAGKAERALAILRPLTSGPGPVESEYLIAHAAAAHLAGHVEESLRLSRQVFAAVPIHLTAKKPNQVMLIGVLNQVPGPITSFISPAKLHFYGNTPAKLAFRHNDEYRLLSIFPEVRSTPSALANAPRPDLILNNWVNAEVLSSPPTLDIITAFTNRLRVPILNHPRKAATTTRQNNAERLAGIPNLVVPRLIRFANKSGIRPQIVRHIGETIGFPVIIRNPFYQLGIGTEKIDSPGELTQLLATLPEKQHYAIEYVDNPAEQGAYRKIRAAVIGEELFIAHVHFGRRWNVHRDRDAEELKVFDPNGKFAAQAVRIIAAPEETLGRPAMAALHEIRSRIPLDFYGIDFDVMPDGRVLFFEANAAMNLSLSDRAGREETRAAMRAALRRLFLKTAGIKPG
jgi:tetratricopeptide (TPR) repeat protein